MPSNNDKITTKIASLPPGSTYFSLEFFPPKTPQGFSNLHARLSRMAHSLRPLFVNVTWGAGGSTHEKSLALAELTQRDLALTTCLHLTCTNMSRKLVDQALEACKALGVRNVLALRGDPPRSEEYRDPAKGTAEAEEDDSNRDFTWAVDLVRYIRRNYGDWFCIGVAGYPEGHSDQSVPEEQSVERDLAFLVEKTRAGADFVMTQLFYDVEAFLRYERTLREHESGVFRDLPIVPGLMPVQSWQILRRTTKLSHARIPPEVLGRLEVVKGDDEAVKRVGVDVISEMIARMRETPDRLPRGFHFYTLNLEKAVANVLERCGLIAPFTPPPQIAVPDANSPTGEDAVAVEDSDGYMLVDSDATAKRKQRRASSLANANPHNRVVVPSSRRPSNPSHEAPSPTAGVPQPPLPGTRANALAISEGEGTLGREATWDDYPNGRWGDARSPAFGEIDGYGVSLHVSLADARNLWGHPTSTADITTIFERHLLGAIPSIPWSEEGLSPETLTIRPQLLSLIQRGWWTVASQPAVRGLPSTDPIFGWGPPNGYVFQKPFVEFFLPSQDWTKLQPHLSKNSQLTFFAANAAGHFVSNDPASVNPVTWGCFTGKEIIAPTIIEAVSFRAWVEEAFGLWAEWGRVYPVGSPGARLMHQVRSEFWLVSVIGHGFLEEGALWADLLGLGLGEGDE
ncbi:hypothetical protein MBLNU230_g4801t1 [Neophaeotheca triangularis]